MGIRKWQVLDLAYRLGEITADDVADELGVTRENACMILLRAHKKGGWLWRRKIWDGDRIVYGYRLSDRSLRFLEKFGSFFDHPWFGFG